MKRTLLTCVLMLGLTSHGNGAIAQDCIQTKLGETERKWICEGLSEAGVSPEQTAFLSSYSSDHQAAHKEVAGKHPPAYSDHKPDALNNLPNAWSILGSAFQ